MPGNWVKFTLLFIMASALLLAGFLLAWYPHSVIESKETQLDQGGLTQSEIGNLQGSLSWWRAQGIFYYGSASNFVLASGILVLVYAIVYSMLSTWRESIKAKQIDAKRQEVSQAAFEEQETGVRLEKTKKTEKISFLIAGGLLAIIVSCIALAFSCILVSNGIITDSAQVSIQDVNYLADGAFGILVSGVVLTGGIMILKRKHFAYAIIAMCFMVVKGATFTVSTGSDFWGLFIGIDILTLTLISLIFTLISYKKFS